MTIKADDISRIIREQIKDYEDLALELIGGKQVSLALIAETRVSGADAIATRTIAARRPVALPSRLLAEEFAAHEKLVATLGPESIWAKYADLAPKLGTHAEKG